MKIANPLAALALLLLLPCCRMGCSSSASLSAWPGVLSAGLESSHVLRSGDGSAVLGLVVRPPEAPDASSAVAISLVVDTSGSMAGHNIEHARSAARAVAESLNDGDEASLVAFESSASTLFPLTRIDKKSRAELLTAIGRLTDLGSTALFDGVRLGVESLARARNPVRRLLLISDGMANVGPSTAEQIVAGLAPIAGGVTLSTLGVGTQYDEAVLWAIAEHGAGGFHHLTDPVQLKQILAEELRRARTVVGRGAVVEIDGAAGVTVLDGGARALSRVGGAVRVALGDLYAGQQQSLALQVRVPLGGAVEQLLGRVRLRYLPTRGGAEVTYQHDVRYQLTSSAEETARGERPEIMVAADRMRVAHALTDAAALIKEGDLLEAQAILRDERARLQGRRERLGGAQRGDADALIAMLRDPYIDANLAPAAPSGGAGPSLGASASPAAFAALVEEVRQGRPLHETSLTGLGKDRLRVLRNVPYARHGYAFKDPDLQRFFAGLSWYAADARFDNGRLTRLDEDTVALVRGYEGRAALLSATRPAPGAARPAGRGFDALLDQAVAGGRIAAAELSGLDLAQLRLLRNAGYARHGYVFRAADLQAAFGGRPWYHPDPGYAETLLTAHDRANIQAIKAEERTRLASAGDEALRDFQLRSRATAYRALHN